MGSALRGCDHRVRRLRRITHGRVLARAAEAHGVPLTNGRPHHFTGHKTDAGRRAPGDPARTAAAATAGCQVRRWPLVPMFDSGPDCLFRGDRDWVIQVEGPTRLTWDLPRLVEPTIELHAAWVDAHREWGVGMHEDGLGVLPSDELTSATGFSTWLERLDREGNESAVGLADYRCVYRWTVDGDAVVSGIALRHGDDHFIRAAGHIGYGTRPSARRQGLATWALGRILDVARESAGAGSGVDPVSIRCQSSSTRPRPTPARGDPCSRRQIRSSVR